MAELPILIVAASTFFIIPALGELFTERSGILNLGVEGMIISSAAGSFLVAHSLRDMDTGNLFLGGTPNIWIAVFFGMLLGSVLSAIHATITIYFNQNQIVSGIGLTIFGTGLSGLLGRDVVGKSDEITPMQDVPIPLLSDIPFLGEVLFSHNMFVYFSFIMVPVLWFVLFKTKIGIIVRTLGENPHAAHNQGVNVKKIRFLAVVFGGAMAGLGGAYLSIGWQGFWAEGMTSSRGWIVIALVIVGLWHPVTTFLASYVFGLFWVTQFSFQSGINVFGLFTITIPVAFINMIPYITTILVLAIWGFVLGGQKVKRVVGAPSSLTVPFVAD